MPDEADSPSLGLGHPSLTRGLLLSVAVILLISFAGIHLASEKNWVIFFDNFHWTTTFIIAAALAWLGARVGADNERAAKKCFALALTSVAFGQVLWDIQVYNGWNPFPGPSDAFFLGLGFWCIIGLAKSLRGQLSVVSQKALALDTSMLASSILAVTLTLYLPQSDSISAFQLAVLSAYPVFLLTASCFALLTILYIRPRLFWSWILFLATLIILGIIWMKWNHLTLKNALQDGSLYNMSFSVAVPLLGLAAMHWRVSPSGDPQYQERCESILRLFPLAGAIAAYSTVVLVIIVNPNHGVRFAVLLAAALIFLLAIIRQSLMLSSRERVIKAEEALHQSEETFRKLFADSADAILLIDTKGVFVECNQAALDLLKMTREQFLLSPPSRISPEYQPNGRRSAESAPEMIALAYTKGLHRFDWVCINAEGGEFIVEVSLMPIMIHGQTMLHTTWRDVTQRKKIEEELAASEAHLRAILATTKECVKLVARDGTLISINQAGLELIEADTPDVAINHCIYKLMAPEYRHAFKEFNERICDGDAGGSLEFEIIGLKGTRRWMETRAVPFSPPEGGERLQLAFTEEITERKIVESKLRLAASVFTHAREGILITDKNATIVDVNQTFSDNTGYSREEAIGQNPRMFQSGRQSKDLYALMWNSLIEKGYWYGELWNRRKDGEEYAELITISAVYDANRQVSHYVGLFSDITPMKAHQEQLEHIAHFDALTSLPNRLLFSDRLQQALIQSQRRERSLAVAYLDLDGFKDVNDRYGHEVGDELLIAVSTHMKDALREGDTLARMGGDEFVAVLVDLEYAMDYESVVSRLLHAASAPIRIGDTILNVSASIGVSLSPRDGIEPDQLIRQADQAMYQAKQSGKNRYQLFDIEFDQLVKSQTETLDGIRQALVRKEFVLYYQPKVGMSTGEVIGAEALIRWNHPERGILSPAAFLPLIQDDPISVELGEWVIEAALTQVEEWHSAGLDMPVSVNIGARQLQQSHFVTRLSETLAAHPGVLPSCLELEILETNALEDLNLSTEVMDACHKLGVRFALDDFGTGYSSLTHLRYLPTDVIKIDKTFVRDMLTDQEDRHIVKAVVELAKTFGRSVIAEGVETVEHGNALIELGCEHVQGYAIARPMPASELQSWLNTWKPEASWLAK